MGMGESIFLSIGRYQRRTAKPVTRIVTTSEVGSVLPMVDKVVAVTEGW